MKNYTFCFTLFLAFLGTSLYAQDTVILDTNRMVFERGDQVYHVANNPNAPIMTRYRYGTHQDWSEIGMHYEFPEATIGMNTVDKVELLGFEVVFIVNTVVGGLPDTIDYHAYTANLNRFPEGGPIASGTFISDGNLDTGNGNVGIRVYAFNNGNGVEITNPEGFFISLVTNAPSNDDIVVIANNFCLNSPEPDGRGEKRFKVKQTINGEWESLIDIPGNGNLDCDGFIYPILRITESYPVGIEEQAALSLSTKVYPNPSSSRLTIDWTGSEDQVESIELYSFDGRLILQETGIATTSINWDIADIPTGIYSVSINGKTGKIIEQVVITH